MSVFCPLFRLFSPLNALNKKQNPSQKNCKNYINNNFKLLNPVPSSKKILNGHNFYAQISVFNKKAVLLHFIPDKAEVLVMKEDKTTEIKQEKEPFNKIGSEKIRNFYNAAFIDLGELTLFTVQVVRQFFSRPFEHKELLKQLYITGNKSLGLVTLTGLIMGLVLTMQSQPILVQFGVVSLIPGMVSVSMFREIGPVVTGLICAGKISSGIGAEIGAMKVTEQIDAMEVSGTKPLSFVVASRVLATTIMVPLLVFFADACGLIGGYLGMNLFEKMSFQLYMTTAFDMLDFIDVVPAAIKTVVFGFFIGLIGAYKGYQAGMGTESVGLAANSAVVAASLSIFIIDLIAVLVTNLLIRI